MVRLDSGSDKKADYVGGDQRVRQAPLVSDSTPHTIVVAELLMIGGVEPNLGPSDKICYEGWTRDASRFLWPSIGAIEITLAMRVKRLLKYFDPRSKGGSLVLLE